VKKFIRNRHTHAFLKDGRWAEGIEGATEFLTVEDASQAKVHLQLKDVELYYLFGNSPSTEWDVITPLR
jgi:hypothetical protein